MTACAASTGKVSSVVCLFCIAFGFEQKVRAKRGRIIKLKYPDSTSFRCDKYTSHMRSQHPIMFDEYQRLESTDERVAFLESINDPFVNTLHAHEVNREKTPRFQFNQSIVEIIIGDMFFHLDDVDIVTQSRALSLFVCSTESEGEEGENQQGGNLDFYFAKIKTLRRFQLATRLIALDDSFCSVSRQLQVIREDSGIAAYGRASDATVSSYTRIVMAVCLQKLAELLDNV